MIEPNEWQERILRLLRQRYGFDLVDVPDGVGGDKGIEAFSRDGCCYQCYAVQGEPSSAERYERNRDKMTTDLGKFEDNATDLAALFGTTKIRRWVFVIPVHDNKKLVEHAQTKAAQIRAKNLSYVTDDFEVAIVTEDWFTVERNLLLNVGLQKLNLPTVPIEEHAIQAFADTNSEQLQKLDRKVAKITPLQSRGRLKELLLRLYLAGEDALDRLRSYPDLYEAFVSLRSNRAQYVALKSVTQTSASPELLNATIAEFVAEVSKAIKGLGPQTAELLANAATVAWLLECNLDFADPVPPHVEQAT